MALLKKTSKKATETKDSGDVSKPKASSKNISSAFAGTLLHPHITEKAADLASRGVYVFVVNKKATRVDVGAAVKAIYGVQPTSVRVINMDGKRVRFGRFNGRRSDWKKAMVTLPTGTTIDVHQGV